MRAEGACPFATGIKLKTPQAQSAETLSAVVKATCSRNAKSFVGATGSVRRETRIGRQIGYYQPVPGFAMPTQMAILSTRTSAQ